MDYSVFRRNLAKYERAFSDPHVSAKNTLTSSTLNIPTHIQEQEPLNTVKVRRISANDAEELK